MKRLNAIVVLFVLTLSTAHAISLKNAATFAIEHNPQVLAAAANELSTHYAYRQARGGLYPQISMRLTTGTETSNNRFSRLAGFSSVRFHRQENGINLSQLLFDGGKTKGEIRQQGFNLQAADFDFLESQQAILLASAEAFLDVMRTRELIKLSEYNIAVHKRILDFVNLRYKGGAGTVGETQLAESRLALAQIRLNQAKGAAKNANARYLAVIGRPVSKRMTLPSTVAPHLPHRLSQAARVALANNPTLHSSSSQVQSAEQAIKVEKARMFPKFNVEVSGNDNDNIDGIPGLNRDFSALLTVKYDIFRGGSDLAAMNQARSQHLESRHNYNKTRRDIIENVATAWADLQTSVQDYVKSITYVQYLKLVVADYKTQFKLGKRALFNVLDEENELFRARVGLTNSFYDAKINSYRLLADMGQLRTQLL